MTLTSMRRVRNSLKVLSGNFRVFPQVLTLIAIVLHRLSAKSVLITYTKCGYHVPEVR